MQRTSYTNFALRALQLAALDDLTLAGIAPNRNDLRARIAPIERGIPLPKRST